MSTASLAMPQAAVAVPGQTAAPLPAAPGCRVQAPGRLHLGFLDPSATLGRRFGSLGLTLEGFETTVDLVLSERDAVLADAQAADDAAERAADIERAAMYLQRLRRGCGLDESRLPPLQLRLRQRLPAHAGLGSGTQLALAIGRAFAQLHGLSVDTPTLARWLGRGLRSGVGIAGFDLGGLLLDGGPGTVAAVEHDGVPAVCPAPLLSRLAFPSTWRLIVVQDQRLRGLSGQREKQAMASLPPLPQALAADVCHQVLMRVLPGAADADFALFACGLNRVQQVLGDYFAPAQAGRAYTSADVGHALQWMAEADAVAVGQSSWGPTGFAVLPDAERADALLRAARHCGVLPPGLQARVVAARNQGALCQPLPSHLPSP